MLQVMLRWNARMLTERKGKRLRLDLRVEFDVLNEDHTLAWRGEGRLHDLSPGGCAFYCERDVSVGNRVHVRIFLKGELAEKFHHTELNARGAVVRSIHESDRYLLSVRFLPAKSGD